VEQAGPHELTAHVVGARPGAPRYVASGEVSGRLLNQYSLSDYAGYQRVATTTAVAL
jgi:Beta propeller domain